MRRRLRFQCLAALAMAGLGGCGSDPIEVGEDSGPAGRRGAEPEAGPRSIEHEDGLLVEIAQAGEGPAAGPGSTVRLHYEAFLDDSGTPFDSTYAGGTPLCVRLERDARPRVIDGLRRGLSGLRAGARATLHIPAALAWGEAGNPSIGVGENANVVMKVHLLSVE